MRELKLSTRFAALLAAFAVGLTLSGGFLAGSAIPARAQQAAPDSSGTSGSPAGSLSKQLNRSNGIIVPPEHVDPKLAKPTPELNEHSTPVIPPPGSPGGDTTVKPK